LASYDIHGWPAFNFAMLLQAIRLCRREDALEREFTPFRLIDMLLAHEGEFEEFSGNTISFGGFGLNIEAVGPLRQNAIEFLDFTLASGRENFAVKAVQSLKSLLHQHLNRVVRVSPETEVAWQNAERLHALDILVRRLEQPASLPVRGQVYSAVRSGTGINCPELVRNAAFAALTKLHRDPDLVVFDALCTGDGGLPILTPGFDADTWEAPIQKLAQEAHDVLLSTPDPHRRAALLLADLKLAARAKIAAGGFERLVRTFAADSEFLCALVDQLLVDGESDSLLSELSVSLFVLQSYAPLEFHPRAQDILTGESVGQVRAAASALRVFSREATQEDVSQIKAFLAYPDAWVKAMALQAIAYMGKYLHLHSQLLSAALSVDVASEARVATKLAEVFGPYGIPLSSLKSTDASLLLSKFLDIDELDADQGAIPRFLSMLVVAFPDQVLEFLLERLAIERKTRREGKWSYRSIGIGRSDISFASVHDNDRIRLAQKCLDAYLLLEGQAEEYAKLFWDISGAHDESMGLLVAASNPGDERRTKQVAGLIQRSHRRLAFTNLGLTRALLGKHRSVDHRTLIDAFVRDALSFPSGSFAGESNDHFAQHNTGIKTQVEAFPSDGELAALSAALRSTLGRS